MKFIHSPYSPGETIAAIATAPGQGAIAIVRICGKRALDVANSIFSGPVKEYKTHTAHVGRIVHEDGATVDEVLLLVMRGKRSFCGEDTVEIQCHGGSFVAKKILLLCLQAGARAALPGEFSFKAYMNDKIDLTQAEAISQLICAKNDFALQAAENHLQGRLSQEIRSFQKKLTHMAAMLEAWIDVPEEDIAFAPIETIREELKNITLSMQKLASSFFDGKILQDGISLCLVGSPNVGKSSLMNALLDKERAIVSHSPGTTRDLIEDSFQLNGLNVRLLDTAGIRQTDEDIEAQGIERSKEAIEQADLILFVLDCQKGLSETDKSLIELLPVKQSIAIWNKEDLEHKKPPSLPFKHVVTISAKNQTGLDKLHQCIDQLIWKERPPAKNDIIITSLRHKEALCEAIGACERVLLGLETQTSPEFLSLDMRQCLTALGKIIGTDITEELLTSIFSTFCIGK